MKLRNKKTRKVYTVRKDIFVSIIDTGKIEVRVMTPDGHVSFFYGSFNEMLNDWEDYQPVEPLIKDKKIRKTVRAWAEANRYDKLWVYHDRTEISFYNEDDGGNEIIFNTVEKFGLENLKCYTITELCGEEEE